MCDSEDFHHKENCCGIGDQVDGTGMSLGQKKSVRVSGKSLPQTDWDIEEPSIVHPSVSAARQLESPTIISISQTPRKPTVCAERNYAQMEEPPLKEEWSRKCSSQASASGVSKQTMEELKSILQESSLRGTKGTEEARLGKPYTYLPGSTRPDVRQDQASSHKSFVTFKPHSEMSTRGSTSSNSISIQPGCSMDSSSSFRSDVPSKWQSGVRTRTNECSGTNWEQSCPSKTDNCKQHTEHCATQHFISNMEQIKQHIAREHVNYVRFEATDLHGVSRSKTVPVRFFHEKAVHGLPMPRGYLELTLSPKISEVDHGNNNDNPASTANFNSDVLLIPDLSTFRVLRWAEQTARVICDPCTVTGSPLRTSPRLIAKQLLGQLQTLGFSLHSSFTYECCVLGAPDRVGPKTLLFPGTTLLSNHDLPFFHELVDSMYCMGADVESFASASGPGQMEFNLRPEFGIAAADSAFTFRTGIKELARKHNCIASFFTDDGLYNAGVLSHSLWDASGRRSLFHGGETGGELSEMGRKWLAGLLNHSAALSCLMSPGLGCRSHMAKMVKDPKHMVYATCGCNDNSSSFNIKYHGGREMCIDNKVGSAMANPYVVLAATVAAGLDGIKRNLQLESSLNRASGQQRQFAIPVKLEDALVALGEDHVIRSALGEPFVQYFIAMKEFEIETEEMDAERNKCLEYFI